jgi:hypothetical protein
MERADSERLDVVIVNEEIAARYFDSVDKAIGRTLRLRSAQGTMNPLRIVGVVADVHHSALTSPPGPEVYTSVSRHSIKPSTYANYRTNFEAYISPVIGHRKLQDIDVRVLNRFYIHLLESGRAKADNNTKMYEYWKANLHLKDGKGPTPTQISTACGTSRMSSASVRWAGPARNAPN